MEKLETTIKELFEVDGKTEEEVFEMVNQILIKTRKKGLRKKMTTTKKKRRRPVCRPVLLISDSSCDEKIE
tara:strand:- start:226 stop:438 length:213 start_codon:yes stop_codon:yes gene_type:complete